MAQVSTLFDKILVANRGEIACRVMRTARRLGIRTIAVYSEADAQAQHVAQADEAYPIGPAPAQESYLVGERILAAARAAGAQAIHPGYGFLSENADFAAACAAAGIVFIGPPVAAIRAMGSKSAAKALMEASGVPLLPGYHGADQDPSVLRQAADRIGYPVLIKASAGGGGKGMRIVERAGDFEQALALAKGEARSAFSNDQVLLERYLTNPRHIEIQVFGDSHGNVISLFERDCSIQRRHQKVIEEAPAPGITPARREEMGEAGRAAARAVGYVGAGTVEFIAEGDDFYFMEMNTRLQVEHPVTEMITGLDLVEWQFRVAAGEPLPLRQDQLSITGHAIEVRLYAEDPERNFLPSIGTLQHFGVPEEGPHIRVDSGVHSGDTISVHYDPMLAKLIVWDRDRSEAVRRLVHALADCAVVGIRSNLGLLRAVAGHPAFAAAELSTGFIAQHVSDLARAPGPPPAHILAAAVQHVLAERQSARRGAAAMEDPDSPWNLVTAWRLNAAGYQDVVLRVGSENYVVRAWTTPTGLRLDLPGGPAELAAPTPADVSGSHLHLRMNGIRMPLGLVQRGAELTVIDDGVNHLLRVVDPLESVRSDTAAGGRLTAPMPAMVIQVRVKPGDQVARGAVLIMLEAMKMQMQIQSPADGIVKAVHYRVNDLVEEGAELVSFETAPAP